MPLQVDLEQLDLVLLVLLGVPGVVVALAVNAPEYPIIPLILALYVMMGISIQSRDTLRPCLDCKTPPSLLDQFPHADNPSLTYFGWQLLVVHPSPRLKGR